MRHTGAAGQQKRSNVFYQVVDGYAWHRCQENSGVAARPVDGRQEENGVRRAGAECIRDHAWDIWEIAVAAVNGSAPAPLFVA